MKKNGYIFFFVFLITGYMNAQTPCVSASNIYSFTAGGINYEVVKEAKTWTAAAACAVQRGGYLVQINDQAEQTDVYNGILAAGIAANYSPVGDGGGASYIWIGATDKQTEGTWLWDGNDNAMGANFWIGQGQAGANTGSIIAGSFVNWGGKSTSLIKEPDDFNSNQDAGAIAVSPWPYGIAGEWNDIAITNSIFYIIEYPFITGFSETEKRHVQIQIFPNPTKDKLELTSTIELKKVEFRSLEGKALKVIYNPKGLEIIDFSEYGKGIYFVDITTKDNALITKKIVKE